MKRTTIIATILVLVFSTTVIAADGDVSRLVPTEKVTAYKDGQKIAEYTQEMPVPENVLLSCKGKCGIITEDLSLVGEDQSRFLIDSEQNSRYLGVEEGTVYFGISTMPRKIIFMTPKGAVSVNQVFIDASSNAKMLEGYIKVTEEFSEIGVLEGGSLQLLTDEGQKVIKPGQRFVLAQADMGGETSGTSGSGSTGFHNQGGFLANLTSGQIEFITTVAIAGGVSSLGAALHDKDKTRDASPSQPVEE